MAHNLETPLAKVRGLGASKTGAEHFIKQRVSAIILFLTLPWALWSAAMMANSGTSVTIWLSNPLNGMMALVTLGAALYHARLGMQVVIEDYIGRHSTRAALLFLNTIIAGLSFLGAAYAIITIAASSL